MPVVLLTIEGVNRTTAFQRGVCKFAYVTKVQFQSCSSCIPNSFDIEIHHVCLLRHLDVVEFTTFRCVIITDRQQAGSYSLQKI